MYACFQDHLDAVAPHLTDHHLTALEKVLAGWSTSGEENAIRACDIARTIVTMPGLSLRERQSKLHQFICDMGTPSHDD